MSSGTGHIGASASFPGSSPPDRLASSHQSFASRPRPNRLTSIERIAFCSASLNVRPIDIASPTDFIWVVSVSSASGNFSNVHRGIFTTT